MKNKLILDYVIAIISLIGGIIAAVTSEWILLALYGVITGYLIYTVIYNTIGYIEYKKTEIEFIEYLIENKDKIIEANNELKYNYIFENSLDNDKK